MKYFHNVRKRDGRPEAYGMGSCADRKFASLGSYSGSVPGQS